MAQQGDAYLQFNRLKRKVFWLKWELIFVGFLALLIGLYPVFLQQGTLPGFLTFLPGEGAGYRVLVMILGGLALVLGFRTTRH